MGAIALLELIGDQTAGIDTSHNEQLQWGRARIRQYCTMDKGVDGAAGHSVFQITLVDTCPLAVAWNLFLALVKFVECRKHGPEWLGATIFVCLIAKHKIGQFSLMPGASWPRSGDDRHERCHHCHAHHRAQDLHVGSWSIFGISS